MRIAVPLIPTKLRNFAKTFIIHPEFVEKFVEFRSTNQPASGPAEFYPAPTRNPGSENLRLIIFFFLLHLSMLVNKLKSAPFPLAVTLSRSGLKQFLRTDIVSPDLCGRLEKSNQF